MKHTRMRTVKAWAVIDGINDFEVFLSKEVALKSYEYDVKYKSIQTKPILFTPCTITYTITNPRSRTK